MKRNRIACAALAVSMLLLTGCGSNSTASQPLSEPQAEVSDNTFQQTAAIQNTSVATAPTYDQVDLDLSVLNDLLLYSQLYNMADAPGPYQGKVIKLFGRLEEKLSLSNEKVLCTTTYDETNCCYQTVELIFDENTETPIAGQYVTLIGVYDAYRNAGQYQNRLVATVCQ